MGLLETLAMFGMPQESGAAEAAKNATEASAKLKYRSMKDYFSAKPSYEDKAPVPDTKGKIQQPVVTKKPLQKPNVEATPKPQEEQKIESPTEQGEIFSAEAGPKGIIQFLERLQVSNPDAYKRLNVKWSEKAPDLRDPSEIEAAVLAASDFPLTGESNLATSRRNLASSLEDIQRKETLLRKNPLLQVDWSIPQQLADRVTGNRPLKMEAPQTADDVAKQRIAMEKMLAEMDLQTYGEDLKKLKEMFSDYPTMAEFGVAPAKPPPAPRSTNNKDANFYIPGHVWDGKTRPTSAKMNELRDTFANTESTGELLVRLKDQVKNLSAMNLLAPGVINTDKSKQARLAIQGTVSKLQMGMGKANKLGVLSISDYQKLESMVADPTKLNKAITEGFGSIMNQYDLAYADMINETALKLRMNGFSKDEQAYNEVMSGIAQVSGIPAEKNPMDAQAREKAKNLLKRRFGGK